MSIIADSVHTVQTVHSATTVQSAKIRVPLRVYTIFEIHNKAPLCATEKTPIGHGEKTTGNVIFAILLAERCLVGQAGEGQRQHDATLGTAEYERPILLFVVHTQP
jgi:hypothetical protein